jgi:hypothetical protein
MKLPDLFPPADLLDRIDGVEEGLQKRKRLGLLGLVGAVASVTQILYNSTWLEGLFHLDWRPVLHDWPALVAALAFALFVVLFAWSKFWLRESRQPFNYTYFIGEFKAVDKQVTEPSMTYLPVDLSERLSKRITRLSRFDEGTASDEAKAKRTSHLHVEGDYLVRRESTTEGDRWVLEVMPWVRVGQSGNRETLALPVKFPLGSVRDALDKPPKLDPQPYRLLVERVYYSIASQVYQQIRADVRRKIELLPTRYFRAMAYYNEARDYARSNTLDAYEAARELYDEAVAMYDPRWRPEPKSGLRRALLYGQKVVFEVARSFRQDASKGFPALGRVDVMMARAMIGYADMILYRHVLAGMAGLSMSPIFEARPVAHRAAKDLRAMPPDVPDRSDALFDAYVALATAYFYLGSTGEDDTNPADDSLDKPAMEVMVESVGGGQQDEPRDAFSYLKKARQQDPARADRDPKFLFVQGKLERRIQWELRLLRRAVELDPKFEVAQFELALRSELHWRQAQLERGTAKLVVREYESVLAINPGNISALARLGDLFWLLAGPAHRPASNDQRDYRLMSQSQFVRGREYKEFRQATFIAELDYGLARLAAEAGEFDAAYDHYSSAVSAHVAYGVDHARGGYTTQFHFFDRINDEILQRYRRYVRRVERCVAMAAPRDRGGRDRRIRDAVLGYALNDYGEACFRYWLRFGGDREPAEARKALEKAWRLSGKELVFSAYNLHLLERHADEFEPAIKWVDEVKRVEPRWPDGRLARRAAYTEWARRAQIMLEEYRPTLKREQKELEKLERRRERWQRPLKSERGLAGSLTVGDQSAAVGVAVQALPLPPSSQSDTAIRRLDEQISSVRDTITGLQHELAKQEGYLRTARQEAVKNAGQEVPHEWLAWLWDGVPTATRLRQVDREGDRARRRWERDLDDVHVRVLISWALASWAVTGGDGKAGSRPKAQKVSRELLERLQKHFWPDDLDVLVALREMCAGGDRPKEQDYNRRIRAVILRQCKEDPEYTLVSWAMVDQALTVQDKLKMLEQLADISKISADAWSKLFVQAFIGTDASDSERATKAIKRLDLQRQPVAQKWQEIGQQLAAADRPEMSSLAYERAIERSKDPEFLAALGDELAAPPRLNWDLSLQAFRKAMEQAQRKEKRRARTA